MKAIFFTHSCQEEYQVACIYIGFARSVIQVGEERDNIDFIRTLSPKAAVSLEQAINY